MNISRARVDESAPPATTAPAARISASVIIGSATGALPVDSGRVRREQRLSGHAIRFLAQAHYVHRGPEYRIVLGENRWLLDILRRADVARPGHWHRAVVLECARCRQWCEGALSLHDSDAAALGCRIWRQIEKRVPEMTKSPSVIEFKETVRDAFGYLGRDFVFREVEPPAKHVDVNPFLVWFANSTTLVQVEGINYGFATQVLLGPADTPDALDATVPLWAIIKHRRPDLYEGAFSRSSEQLADIRAHARALREAADDVLQGDFRVFDDARAIINAQAIHQRLTEQEESRNYHQQIAVVRAADAFRAKDFNHVIELLSPHADHLTPAERAKLDYARARLATGGSEVSRDP